MHFVIIVLMKLAFIGGHGHHYLKALTKRPDLELQIAVASDGFDAPAARHSWQKLAAPSKNEPLWFDSPQQLFDEFAPDIVNIGAVYAHNGTIAAQALERDVAVVCDKPIAANWAQLERLRELTKGNARVLLTEFPFRCQREFRAARQAVQNGQIGEVVLASAQKSYRFGASRPAWYARREDYAGTLFWIASHGIDAIHFCGGVPFAGALSVGGNGSRPEYGSMEDHVVALFGLKNGGHAVVHADFLRPANAPSHGDDRLRIAGTLGVVEVQNGRCLLIGEAGEIDITDSVEVQPIEDEFLAATRGEKSVYSTEESLEIAEVLLRANDARQSLGL